MAKTLYPAIVLCLLILTGCITEWDKMLDTDTLDSEIIEISDNISEKNFKIKIKEYRNNLIVDMKLKLPKDFPFPVSEKNNEKLTYSSFYIVFYYNSEVLKTNAKTRFRTDYLTDTSNLVSFTTHEKNLAAKEIEYEFEIPMLLFHNVKSGEQELEVVVFQRSFSNNPLYNYGSNEYDEKETQKISLIKQKLKFKLDMPEIKETMICLNGIVLQDDDEFSPEGMDFSFRKGYPDIYWTIFYPARSDKDYTNRYYMSEIENYAVRYNRMDTVRFYHYDKLNNINIGVYDHDDLNRDDFLGEWFGSFEELIPDNDDYKIISFDHVDTMYIKALPNGVTN